MHLDPITTLKTRTRPRLRFNPFAHLPHHYKCKSCACFTESSTVTHRTAVPPLPTQVQNRSKPRVSDTFPEARFSCIKLGLWQTLDNLPAYNLLCQAKMGSPSLRYGYSGMHRKVKGLQCWASHTHIELNPVMRPKWTGAIIPKQVFWRERDYVSRTGLEGVLWFRCLHLGTMACVYGNPTQSPSRWSIIRQQSPEHLSYFINWKWNFHNSVIYCLSAPLPQWFLSPREGVTPLHIRWWLSTLRPWCKLP